ncbi:unnamed protein product [Mycena citricolor]|uniref:BTB domain-containing protein n=1 Tax=Mycena citricolor TaxID=2018698 RepID=A0AAD2Q6Y9_9AGAR|nr:unnamed protein product [Mycena citricolor]
MDANAWDPSSTPVVSDFDYFRWQLWTPPPSDQGSPGPVVQEQNYAQMTVSSTFGPEAEFLSQTPDGDCASAPDIVLRTSDGVNFYVHSDKIDVESHRLSGHITSIHHRDGPSVVDVPETSTVLNVILHALYGISCAQYSPSVDVLVEAVDSMLSYGMDPQSFILPSTTLYSMLLSQAPLSPLRVYTLAARYDIMELAVPTSSHLLSFQLSALTDADVEEMGPVYLKRLMFMHNGRIDALRRALMPPPYPHPPTSECSFANQKSLTRAWTMAAAYLAWDIRPDMSTHTIEASLRPLSNLLPCNLCKRALNDRIKSVVIQWSLVKVCSPAVSLSSVADARSSPQSEPK